MENKQEVGSCGNTKFKVQLDLSTSTEPPTWEFKGEPPRAPRYYNLGRKEEVFNFVNFFFGDAQDKLVTNADSTRKLISALKERLLEAWRRNNGWGWHEDRRRLNAGMNKSTSEAFRSMKLKPKCELCGN